MKEKTTELEAEGYEILEAPGSKPLSFFDMLRAVAGLSQGVRTIKVRDLQTNEIIQLRAHEDAEALIVEKSGKPALFRAPDAIPGYITASMSFAEAVE